MSLIRPSDFVTSSVVINPYWTQLLNTVDEFDQLMELQKRQIATCVKQFNQKRIELVRQFSQFKDSLRFQGEVPKQQFYFVQMDQFNTIFKGYYSTIVDLIEKVVLEPKMLAELLGTYVDTKRLRFDDFFQNVVFNIYPYYLPSSKKAPTMAFVRELFSQWAYSVQLVRPTQYSLIDQAIGGLMKAPSIVCYIEKIVSYFLQEVGKCHMQAFAFDQEAISNELNVKKNVNATFSHTEQRPTSFRDKIKGFFGRTPKAPSSDLLLQSRISVSNDMSTNEFSFLSQDQGIKNEGRTDIYFIMRKRQERFFELFENTAKFILNQEVPLFLCRILVCFDDYLDTMCGKGDHRLKHYCYFLMTNLILSELHNKFTISHQESGMTPADLQNISEVIKFLNGLFQGVIIQSDKYRIRVHQYFEGYQSKIKQFYENVLARGRMAPNDEGELLQNLLVHYEKSVVLSINDLVLIHTMLKSAGGKLETPEITKLGQFNQSKEMRELTEGALVNRTIKYKGGNRSSEHVYLVYDTKRPSIRQIIDYYLRVDQPITDIPFIRQILLGQSHMEIQQTLEIENDLKLIQKLPIKQLKGYLSKLAHKHRELKVRDSRVLQLKFQESFKSTLTRSLHRKEWLLYYKSELNHSLSRQSELMNYFSRELNSAQFYLRMANSFCDSVRLKIYLNIEDNLFKVHENAQDLKKIQISTLMVAKDDSKSTSSNDNYILRNSFKIFENYKEIIKCFAKNEITMMALNKGRKVDEFNEVFQKVADIIVSRVKDFVSKKHILQVLSEQKLGLIIVKQMQDTIMKYFRHKSLKNDKDSELFESSRRINKLQFWKRDLEEYGLDRQFIVSQGVQKFREMIDETNVGNRLKHFEEFFKIIFTILGLTMAKNKISAEIVNPLVQYIILECADFKHHDCLYSIQALKWRQTPEDIYHLTLYQSSLTYIRELMPNDYSL